ncbi:hypothetical protein [Qipengyuania sp. ASV99]|uniref:hypothetical protein n=1 Tax=Qipengyuania sp. ASV99 TaxID=3399681 RepID=UPI003A4C718A
MMRKMALLLLIVIGLSAGWFASILARDEASGEILRQMGAGLAASLLAGLMVNSGTVLGGLSLFALLAAIAASAAVLAGYHAIMRRRTEV